MGRRYAFIEEVPEGRLDLESRLRAQVAGIDVAGSQKGGRSPARSAKLAKPGRSAKRSVGALIRNWLK